MLTKFLKSVIALTAALMFFCGTAMADNWHRDGHHPNKWHNYHANHRPADRPHFAQRDYGHAMPPRAHYRQPGLQASNLHPLAPRIVFLGPLPIPVPPPPHEVLDFLTGR